MTSIASWRGLSATVHIGNEQLSCPILDADASGLILAAPSKAKVGAFLRMQVRLAGETPIIALDGVLAREVQLHSAIGWRVRYHEVDEATAEKVIQGTKAKAPASSKSPSRQKPKGVGHLALVLGRRIVGEYHIEGQRAAIGRHEAQDIVIDNRSVSRRHCEIVMQRGTATLRDLGGANKTLLNGRPAQEEKLAPGDEIGVGKHILLFRPPISRLTRFERHPTQSRPSGPYESAVTTKLSDEQLFNTLRQLLQSRRAHLKQVAPEAGATYYLKRDINLLGKGEQAEIPLRGTFVAPGHAKIERNASGRFTVVHLAGRSALRVNGVRKKRHDLRHGDEIKIGKSCFVYYEDA